MAPRLALDWRYADYCAQMMNRIHRRMPSAHVPASRVEIASQCAASLVSPQRPFIGKLFEARSLGFCLSSSVGDQAVDDE